MWIDNIVIHVYSKFYICNSFANINLPSSISQILH